MATDAGSTHPTGMHSCHECLCTVYYPFWDMRININRLIRLISVLINKIKKQFEFKNVMMGDRALIHSTLSHS